MKEIIIENVNSLTFRSVLVEFSKKYFIIGYELNSITEILKINYVDTEKM